MGSGDENALELDKLLSHWTAQDGNTYYISVTSVFSGKKVSVSFHFDRGAPGMLVYGHGKRNGSQARASYLRTSVAFHDILT